MLTTAPGRSTCPASKSTRAIKATASVPGINSALLEEAERNGQELVLDVLTVNRRAHALYRRLGLTEVARHGDRGTKVTMRSAHHRK